VSEGLPGQARCRLYLIGPAAPSSAAQIEQALDARTSPAFCCRRPSSHPMRRSGCTARPGAGRGLPHRRGCRAGGRARRRRRAPVGSGRTMARRAALSDPTPIVGVACGNFAPSRHGGGRARRRLRRLHGRSEEDLEVPERLERGDIVPCVAWVRGPTPPPTSSPPAPISSAVDDIWTAPGGAAAALRTYALAGRRSRAFSLHRWSCWSATRR